MTLRTDGLLVACLLLANSCAAADWPQWRGPDRDGQAQGIAAPESWPPNLRRVWQVEIGQGHASPVVVGGRVFTFARQGDREVVACRRLDDGQEVWSAAYDAPYEVNGVARDHGAGPKSTPCAADGRLYTLGIGGILSGWNAADGERLWQHEYSADFEATSPLYGSASSPLAIEQTCLAQVGGHDGGAIVQVDGRSGREVWRWAADGPAYTSPILIRRGRTTHVVTQTQTACLAIATGAKQPAWRIDFATEYDQNSITPLAIDGTIVFGGYNRSTLALRTGRGQPEPAWENGDVPLYMSSPVLAGGKLFAFTQRDSGRLVALDPADGRIVWEGPPRQGDNASLVAMGELLLALTTEARLLVYDLSADEPRLLVEYFVADSPTWAHAVPTADGVLVKDAATLSRWSWAN
jgi:outer membrane protein assembly factor BamB